MTSSFTTAALAASVLATSLLAVAPVRAADEAVLTHCDAPYGKVAITEGTNQGWSELKLSSPRPLLADIIAKSGCFTMINPASGEAADYLMTAEAGTKEEIDQAMSMASSAASSAATQALIHSGALTKVPGVGAVAGLLGGFGGKKQSTMAALRLVSPQNGMTVAAASGERSKSVMKVMNASEWQSLGGGSYSSKNGVMLTSAFVDAFNSLVAQAATLPPPATAAGQAAGENYIVAVDANLLAAGAPGAAPVRALRAGTELTPTGNRSGLFVEVTDNYGTKGWVSVEQLQ